MTSESDTGNGNDGGTDRANDLGTDGGVDNDSDIDPAVADLVVTIRDRFGLRGMRDAQAMLTQEIGLAEKAIASLAVD